jgi:riboflavin synthase
MFTGIVQAILKIETMEPMDGYTRISLTFPDALLSGLSIGASVAIDGICCTVVAVNKNDVAFEVINESILITNLKNRAVNDWVNIERAAIIGGENSGHIISGHVSGTAEVIKINTTSANNFITFKVPVDQTKYIFQKGFIALNGVSLTVAETEVVTGISTANIIPETLRQTSFPHYKAGDEINFEIEYQTQVIVDTIERCIPRRRQWH